MKYLRVSLVTTLMVASLGNPLIAREPARTEVPLTPSKRDWIARLFIDRSVVIAEGKIVWSKRGWLAVRSGKLESLNALSVLQTLPKLKPSKVIKGPALTLYNLISEENGTPQLYKIPPGTLVRLLLVPYKTRQGYTVWEVSDTSYSGRREDERSIDVAIDKILGSKRQTATSLQDEPVPLP